MNIRGHWESSYSEVKHTVRWSMGIEWDPWELYEHVSCQLLYFQHHASSARKKGTMHATRPRHRPRSPTSHIPKGHTRCPSNSNVFSAFSEQLAHALWACNMSHWLHTIVIKRSLIHCRWFQPVLSCRLQPIPSSKQSHGSKGMACKEHRTSHRTKNPEDITDQ